jgi:hypothetical protein
MLNLMMLICISMLLFRFILPVHFCTTYATEVEGIMQQQQPRLLIQVSWVG